MDKTTATTEVRQPHATAVCEICGGIFPIADLSNQGGTGDICPHCRAETESCGCSD